MNPDPIACPIPVSPGEEVLMSHGGGGRHMHQLLERLFLRAFSNPALDRRHDGAVLEVSGGRLAFTTDSYVVRPLFFPGGDIGRLAVFGTVNDLAMCGARARWLSAGFVIEEGFPMEMLRRVVESMRRAADEAGVAVVTGDTKVVDRGRGDGLYLNTSGIGIIGEGVEIGPERVETGDVVLVSGDIGRHGMAVMSVREGLGFEPEIGSDCAPLTAPVLELLGAGVEIHCLRDCTRGGVAAALHEIASARGVRVDLEEALVPVRDDVRGACEILGLDPLHVANEGRFVALVPATEVARALEILRRHPVSAGAVAIGSVSGGGSGWVTLRNALGIERFVDLPAGEPLPRIC